MEEMVPTRMPANRVKEKPNRASPPNSSRAPTVNNVVPEVIMVRLKVALMATSEHWWIPIWVREPSRSRSRSEMTMLSLSE